MRIVLGKGTLRTSGVAGFAAHWTWIWCTFWSALFYGEAVRTSEFMASNASFFFNLVPLEPLWTVSLCANVAAIAILLLATRTRSLLSLAGILAPSAAVLTTSGTACLTHVALLVAGNASGILYMLGSVLTGFGSGAVVCLWAEAFSSLGPKRVVTYSVVSLLAAALLYVVIELLPLDAAQAIVAVLPLASMGCLMRFERVECKHCAGRIKKGSCRLPVRMIVIAMFFGLSFGAMKGLIVPVESAWIGVRDVFNILAIVGGAVAIYVTASVCKMDFDHLTYQVALPLMAVGFLVLPLREPWNVVGTAVHQFGYQYFYVVLWALWPVLAQRGKVSPGWIACWGLLSVQLGQFVGSVAAASALALISDELGLAMLSGSIVFMILIIALFAMGNSSVKTGWGYIKPSEEPSASSSLERGAFEIAREKGLSPREEEVFLLLAKGRNRAYIRNELVIGDETVKSHVKNIYKKTDVHSQQDLIDLVEAYAAEEEMARA